MPTVEKQQLIIYWEIPSNFDGLRADIYLQRKIGRISRTQAQKIIISKNFKIENTNIKPATRVHVGQRASLIKNSPDSIKDLAFIEPKIIYEDTNLLILDKPAGLTIHPNASCLFKTLTQWLKINYPNKNIHPCHRIDKETSGVLICAKNFSTQSDIKKLFMLGEINKTYLAITKNLIQNKFINNNSLSIQGSRGLVRIKIIKDNLGKPACTYFRPIRIFPDLNLSLVMCKPKTGRQHQIRAHLAQSGFPIIGDKLYFHGEEFFDKYTKRQILESDLSYSRHMLHAYKIRFIINNKKYVFTSQIPEDFKCENFLEF